MELIIDPKRKTCPLSVDQSLLAPPAPDPHLLLLRRRRRRCTVVDVGHVRSVSPPVLLLSHFHPFTHARAEAALLPLPV